jgi:hypothetical protein
VILACSWICGALHVGNEFFKPAGCEIEKPSSLL